MTDRDAKDALFDAFAEVAKALSSGRRAELIDVLAQGVDTFGGAGGEDKARAYEVYGYAFLAVNPDGEW